MSNDKHGRMKEKCKRYAAEHRRERNKIRRLRTYIKKFPRDFQAKKALEKLL